MEQTFPTDTVAFETAIRENFEELWPGLSTLKPSVNIARNNGQDLSSRQALDFLGQYRQNPHPTAARFTF